MRIGTRQTAHRSNLSLAAAPGKEKSSRDILPWLIMLAGLGAMYVPTFIDFSLGIWSSDRYAHGPLVLGVAMWFFYFHWKRLARQGVDLTPEPALVLGWSVLVVGLLLYALGRSQSIPSFELGSLVPVLLGVLFLCFGRRIAARFWLVFILLLFAVPLPASMMDVATQPMKMVASFGAEHVLHWLGYPVARSGVIITIGHYQLLVADACAGLNSLFSLEAMGLLYMNLIRHESMFRNVALALLIVPISLSSNVVRIVILSLLTYHFGDDVGQGFLHGFSGMALFVIALFLIIGVDTALRGFSTRPSRQQVAG